MGVRGKIPRRDWGVLEEERKFNSNVGSRTNYEGRGESASE